MASVQNEVLSSLDCVTGREDRSGHDRARSKNLIFSDHNQADLHSETASTTSLGVWGPKWAVTAAVPRPVVCRPAQPRKAAADRSSVPFRSVLFAPSLSLLPYAPFSCSEPPSRFLKQKCLFAALVAESRPDATFFGQDVGFRRSLRAHVRRPGGIAHRCHLCDSGTVTFSKLSSPERRSLTLPLVSSPLSPRGRWLFCMTGHLCLWDHVSDLVQACAVHAPACAEFGV